MSDPRPYPFTFASEMLAKPPRKSWIVRDLFAYKELSVVFGAPGDGKSVLIGDIACHSAAGLNWFGHEVFSPRAVLYLAAERANLVKRRVAAFMKDRGLDDIQLAVVEASPDITNSEDIKRLVETMWTLLDDEKASARAWADFDGFDWVIVDTKARTMGGSDENAAKDMNRFVAGLGAIQREIGGHVTVIDHTPHHDKARMRGSSALLGAVDVTFRVQKTGGARLFEIDKVNDGRDDISHAFDLRSVTLRIDEDGREETAPVVVPVEAPHRSHSGPRQKLSDRQKLAREALAETILAMGKPAPASFGLRAEVRTVLVSQWREEVYARGVIPAESKNPSADFIRLRESLAARHCIGLREDHVWLAE